MYQLIGNINDTKVGGLASLLNYKNENVFSKGAPAFNGRHYHITKTIMKIYIIFTMSVKNKTFNTKKNEFY